MGDSNEGMFGLRDQVAVVTGAAMGLGEGIARRLAAAGATIAVADINREAAQAVAGSIPCAFAIPVDVTSSQSVQQAVKQIVQRTGKIDILINNAGIAGRAAPVWELSDEEWQRTLSINLNGVFHFCRAVIPGMRSRGYGRIVNIASIAGKEGNPRMSCYSASKAAVIGFTKSVGKELATEGICVNAVAPAVVHTPILDQLTPEQVAYMTEKIPMRRTGKLEEIAAVVHFLSSPDCSFVTGQCYDASGGRATY
jgi:3-oxoacyl-[acyl-carrier protein] reductase